jgi:flavin-dependent dehydrogenase
MPKRDLPIVIAGAGPAGASLAIRFRALGRDVILIERYKFPRHKLCGEFISPECLAHFEQMDVLNEMLAAGGDRIYETRFIEMSGRSVSVPSQWFGSRDFALSLSRARMDNILLNAAQDRGAAVMEETNVIGLITEDGRVRGVKVRDPEGRVSVVKASIVVDATGRSRVLSKLAEKIAGDVEEAKPRFVGFKAHLSGVEMPKGVCEIYGFKDGYAGLSFIENGDANLCFLARASLQKDKRDADRIVEESLKQNVRAAETLRRVERIQDWIAVSVPAFGVSRRPVLKGLFNVGDSAAFIDPFTGSGMLMAIESAEIFAECIAEAGVEQTTLERLYSERYDRGFRSRLRLSGIFRRIAYDPFLARSAVRILSLSDRFRARLARGTRSAEIRHSDGV